MFERMLRAEIIKAGYTVPQLAEKLHMAPSTFYRKMRNGNFGILEAKRMIEILGIKDMNIFFLDAK